MASIFKIHHEYETIRERYGLTPQRGHREYNVHEEIMQEFTRNINLGWVAKWCRDWAPIVAPQTGFDTRPEIALIMEMTDNGNLRISWTPAISYDQYQAAPKECRIWLDDLHRNAAFQSARSEIYFIRSVRRIQSLLNLGRSIYDPELSAVTIKALDTLISDLPRKLKDHAKVYWQDYLFIKQPDGQTGFEGHFELIDAWEYHTNKINEGIRSLEEETGFSQASLDAAVEEITERRNRIRLLESKLKAIAEERGLPPESLQSLHGRYKSRDKFHQARTEDRFCREPHPGRSSRRN